METQPTFARNGILLVGREAVEAWSSQTARCNCGSYGGGEDAISGSCHDMPAKWLGCDNCVGQALGRPLVYRVPSQIATKRSELAATRS